MATSPLKAKAGKLFSGRLRAQFYGECDDRGAAVFFYSSPVTDVQGISAGLAQ
jgi:hypothetical protein